MGLLDELLQQSTNLGRVAGSLPQAFTASVSSVNAAVNSFGQRAGLNFFSGSTFESDNYRIAKSRPDPQINLNWDALLIVPGMEVDLSPYLEEVQLPSISLSAREIFREGTTYKQQDLESLSSMQLQLYEDIYGTTANAFRQWKSALRDSSGNYAPIDLVSGTLILYSKDPTGAYQLQYKCTQVFPTSISGYTYSSGNGDRLICSVELSVDRCILLPP